MRKRPEYSAEIVGKNLKHLRIRRGYSVEEVKDYLCLGSVQAVYKYENGKGFPTADALLALMELYDAEVSDLVGMPVPAGEEIRASCFYSREAGGLFLTLNWPVTGRKGQIRCARRLAETGHSLTKKVE